MRKKYKTRFPMARIKKIMQKDDEVGKIASATPILISKCLEMFLCDLLTKTCDITKSKNARIISVTHLKQCIKGEANFDFLKDIVEKVPDIEPEKPEKRGRPRKGLSASGTLRASKGGADSEEEEEDDDEEEEDEEDDEEEEEEEDSKKKKRGRKPQNQKAKVERKPTKRDSKATTASNNATPFPLTTGSPLAQYPSASPATAAVPSFPANSFGHSQSPFGNPMFAPPTFPVNPPSLSSLLPPRSASPPLSSSYTFSAPPKRVQEDYEEEEEEASGIIQTGKERNVPNLSTMGNPNFMHTVPVPNPRHISTMSIANSNLGLPHLHSPLVPHPQAPSFVRKSNMADILRSSKDVEDYDFSAEFVVQQPKDM